ncbi:MAG: asparagine synthase (glutamine-hydrolyzing) [Candidatus Eremiobacteraeota bacterium]|nr:asparagine synthase (glutamine-hydrolyzing) [Candidatus Eremiobacteraeota bacterium]
MCGIYGIAGKLRRGDDALAALMDQCIAHRGPDDSGIDRSPMGFIGMRRLAIVDLNSGNQPISNEDGSIRVVFNGEIYNYQLLRNQLRALGHTFKTQSDTEILVHAYEAWGDEFVERLSGMFAIAIIDERRQRLFFARDHMGKKPLYFWEDAGRLIFCSEVKGILLHPDFTRTIDGDAFWHYLTFKNIPAPLSIYKGVMQLPQGTSAIWEAGVLRTRQYFRPEFTGELDIAEEEAAAELLRLMRAAVQSRMLVSDVPVGAYLSGGLDSSFIVALAAEFMDRPLDTFSLGYAHPVAHKSDLQYARQIALQYRTNHRELLLTTDQMIAGLPGIVEAFDEPFGAGTSPYYLSALIGEHVKVALTGDGADELFGSYAAHRMAPVVEQVRQGNPHVNFESFFGDRDLALQCAAEDDHVWRTRFCAFTDAEKRELVVGSERFAPSSSWLEPFYQQAYGDLTNRTLEVECRTLLPDQILTYVDRLSMAFSVETRSPFLDRDVVAFAGKLPGNQKVRVDATKSVLRTAARMVLPADIVDRPKEGFVLPIDAWLSHELSPMLLELTNQRWLGHGLFEPAVVRTFVEEHISGKKNHAYKLWSLLMFQLWFARFMEHRDLEDILPGFSLTKKSA